MRPVLRSAAFASLLLAAPVFAQAARLEPTPSAQQILFHTRHTAVAEHKNILLIFSASWCGPCHMFEHFIDDPANKPIIDKVFVVARLDVGERPDDTRHADTPGAVALRADLGGATAGYPYLIMLDASGHPIVSSLRPDPKMPGGNNIGYPAIPVEIDWFMHMLQKAAPNLTPQETATLHTWLTAHPM